MKILELLDLRAHKRFWDDPQTTMKLKACVMRISWCRNSKSLTQPIITWYCITMCWRHDQTSHTSLSHSSNGMSIMTSACGEWLICPEGCVSWNKCNSISVTDLLGFQRRLTTHQCHLVATSNDSHPSTAEPLMETGRVSSETCKWSYFTGTDNHSCLFHKDLVRGNLTLWLVGNSIWTVNTKWKLN